MRIISRIILKDENLENKIWYRFFKVFIIIITVFVFILSLLAFSELKLSQDLKQEKYITQQELKTVFQTNPKSDREGILNEFINRGYQVEGYTPVKKPNTEQIVAEAVIGGASNIAIFLVVSTILFYLSIISIFYLIRFILIYIFHGKKNKLK